MRIRADALAKINWTLSIVGVTENRYHELDMLMQSVEFADQLWFDESDSLSLQITGSYSSNLEASDKNLVIKAAKVLSAQTSCNKGAAIRLHKQIPMEAGMGGGSSDAAATLVSLNRLWQTGLSMEELERISVKIGADVPFCIRGGLQRARGIGEKLTVLRNPPPVDLLVIQPCRGLSAKEVFAAFDQATEANALHADPLAAAEALQARNLDSLQMRIGNDLQRVAVEKRVQIREAMEALKEHGAVAVQMTGSGSAVFGVYWDAADRDSAAAALKGRWPVVYSTKTADQSNRVIIQE